MFLNFTNLKKIAIASPASRNTTRFQNIFCLQKLMKPLSLRPLWKAGRPNGKLILKTRASLLKKYKIAKINYSLHYMQLNIVASFHFVSSSNKLLSLIHFANGSTTYYITTENHILFEYCYLNINKQLRNWITTAYWSPLYLLKKLIFISFVEITPLKHAQYSISAGTQSRLLVIDKTTFTGLIQLPSKIKKTISYYSYVLLGRIALHEKKNHTNIKSGYWRGRGWKPIVRGVAMNPVDHPHGGRTKSVRYPRTPWGKTTKFK